MRNALLGGIAGLLLYGCTSVPAITTQHQPVVTTRSACTAPSDPELIACTSNAPAIPITVSMDTASDFSVSVQEREHAWRLTRSYLMNQGIDLRLTEDNLPLAQTIQPLKISFLDAQQYASYSTTIIGAGLLGCANLLQRTARINAEVFSNANTTMCPANRTALLAVVLTHEIGHLMGLVHVERVSPETTIPMNNRFLRPNVMVADSLPFKQVIAKHSLCSQDLTTLTVDDLPFAMEPIQSAQMRSAALGGRIWELMRSSGFDYQVYEKAYHNALQTHP